MQTAAELLAGIREQNPQMISAAISSVEGRGGGEDTRSELLDALSPGRWPGELATHIVGLTGPPGAGKSSLSRELIRVWRERDMRVGVLAVDPSSRKSGGALLGDRIRMAASPDPGVFIRSQATELRLGGLAPATRASAQILGAAYDIVLIETVGSGQSEAAVRDLCDSLILVIQPGAGDSLQYLKAGIMELPDLFIVHKADLPGAEATRSELAASLGILHQAPTIYTTQALPYALGIEAVVDALGERYTTLDIAYERSHARVQAAYEEFTLLHGTVGRSLFERLGFHAELAERACRDGVHSLIVWMETITH